MTDFLDAVAEIAETDRQTVEGIFSETGVVLSPAVPSPHSLLVTRVHFAGTKHLAEHDPEDFEYDHALGAGLWVVASRDNLAGKSTVLNVIRWALTGRQGKLRDDVRSWISQVTIEGEIDGRPFAIEFDDADASPRGLLTDGGEVVGTFESEDAFETLTGAFFSDRLGLDPMPFWQQRAAGEAEEGDARHHGWQSYFPALHVRSGEGPLLGEQAMGGQPSILMQVYLGLPWTLTYHTSRVAVNVVRRELSAARRRGQDDARARERAREPLQQRLAQAQAGLAELEARASVPSAAQIDAQLATYQRLTSSLSALEPDLEAAAAAVGLAQEAVDAATRQLAALRENATVRPLLGRILPTECPRCTHELEDVRDERDAAAHCYVCDAPLLDEGGSEEVEAEAEAELSEASEALEIAQEELAALGERQRQLVAERNEARVGLDSAEQAQPDNAERERILRDIAVSEALLEQDQGVQQEAHANDELGQRERVLAAAQAEAEQRRNQAADGFLSRLADEIADLGRRFGVANLEDVDPKLNATMKVTTGGAESNFSGLAPGEQLRLRTATLIGLLRIGQQQGIGRFPGLLLVDSPASEEMVDVDAAEIMGELVEVCAELESLQLIIATARPQLIEGLVPGERWLGGADLGMVF